MSAPLFSRLVAKLFARPVSRRARRRVGRLGMECLEDRTVPDGSFSGRLWLDADADGVQDSGEPGVAGALVEAFDNSWSVAASTTTDADGYYTVTGVPNDSCNGRYTLPGGTPYQFWYYGSGSTDTYYPTYVGATIDLPVYGPPAVSVAALGDAVEGGALGSFRFTRTGDTSSSLTVTYSVLTGEPNYATNGDDIEELSGTVIIPAGWAYQDVSVLAWADNNYDPDETVMISVQPSPNYTRLGDGTAGLPVIDTSFVVTTTADVVSIPDNRVSLREALTVANGLPQVLIRPITFNFPGTTGTITLGSTLPWIVKAITIDGSEDRGVTITGGVKHMRVQPGGELTLSGLRFLDGRSIDEGGSIFTRGVLDITNCEFRGNQSATSGGAIAGMRNGTEEEASISITNSDINGNTAGAEGGAIFVDGIDLTLFETTIGFNNAVFDGGGIASISSPPVLPPGIPLPPRAGENTISMVSCQIVGNVAGLNGGGVSVRYGHVGFLDTNVEGNRAEEGGGLYADETEVTFLSGGENRFGYDQATGRGKGIYLTGFSFITENPYYEFVGGDDLFDDTV